MDAAESTERLETENRQRLRKYSIGGTLLGITIVLLTVVILVVLNGRSSFKESIAAVHFVSTPAPVSVNSTTAPTAQLNETSSPTSAPSVEAPVTSTIAPVTSTIAPVTSTIAEALGESTGDASLEDLLEADLEETKELLEEFNEAERHGAGRSRDLRRRSQ